MLIVGLRIGMATGTSRLCEIGRVGMAIDAGIPFPVVRSTVNRKILHIVVERRRRPGALGVAGCTIG